MSKWIPVSESLPKRRGVYIITRKFKSYIQCFEYVDTCYFDGTDKWIEDNRIVAWMYLPEPWKGSDE